MAERTALPFSVAAVVLAVALAASLTGCGSSQQSYCSTLKSDKARLATLSAQTAKPGAAGSRALRRTVDVLDALRDKAPDDIHDEWVRVSDAFRGLQQAIADSGADPGDFRGGRRPSGVTSGQVRAVQQAAAELQATPVQQAGKSIEQHAQDVCKVDLGSELGTGG